MVCEMLAAEVRMHRLATTVRTWVAIIAVVVPAAPVLAGGFDGRDPFAPLGVLEPEGPACAEVRGVVCARLDQLTLRGVVTGVASPRALFEDDAGRSHLVRVGDVVDGMRVKALRRQSVVLERTMRDWIGRVSREDVVVSFAG